MFIPVSNGIKIIKNRPRNARVVVENNVASFFRTRCISRTLYSLANYCLVTSDCICVLVVHDLARSLTFVPVESSDYITSCFESPDQGDPLVFPRQTYHTKNEAVCFLMKPRDSSFSPIVTVHSRNYRRQTTYYDNSQTLQYKWHPG